MGASAPYFNARLRAGEGRASIDDREQSMQNDMGGIARHTQWSGEAPAEFPVSALASMTSAHREVRPEAPKRSILTAERNVNRAIYERSRHHIGGTGGIDSPT